MISFFKNIKYRFFNPDIYLSKGKHIPNGVEFDLQRDGVLEKLFYKSFDAELSVSTDVAILPTILQAMKRKRRIVLNNYVSSELILNLKEYMKIYASWYKQYHDVPLLETFTDNEQKQPTGRVATFFSGGVDSFYTLIKHQEEITDLIFVHGFDLSLDDAELRQTVSNIIRRIASDFGVGLIEVETNARIVQKGWGHWGPHAHGLGLASVARALSKSIDKVYIPSSFSKDDLFSWGTHPKTDYLLGDMALKIVHDSVDLKRTEKTIYIGHDNRVLKALRVCYKNVDGTYNCCECEKCLRTMTSLYSINKLKDCKTFPRPLNLDLIKRLDLSSDVKKRFSEETLELLRQNNLHDTDIYKAWSR